MNILILHGPNLNMLGHREKKHYGSGGQDDLMDLLVETFPEVTFNLFQSNNEGELIDRIHAARDESIDGIIVNFGGLTHTSVSLRDALTLLPQDKIEVHLSNIHARESFRHTSLTGGVCRGMISGFGFSGYVMAVRALLENRETS
ncbi:type II 3-dehydroquinate dehydratase [Natronogracilivirga saccharolytica]|uniref:3-dehydroquinate dehydratase n=1 Tax=Natronogracilivirga saccharolytica TaxID=2812953 RepID=A0A8J7RKL7_9BACT|nr:type II 3-dehydroquinate dehydratase [Natronogracilivirga saccharolytica]MBP3193450.1 3-dehydroquinate dehydratase [Natronogracilivirga saccharolytica]